MIGAGTGDDPIPPTIAWAGDHVRIIDQRRLPQELVILELRTVDELCAAIGGLAIRGAPALGAAGAMGVALASVRGEGLAGAAEALRATRPTAVNLTWGVARALEADDPVAAAVRIAADDVAVNRALAEAGRSLVPPGGRVLTHCNAGALACVGYGTALGIVRRAHEDGAVAKVWVDETRPVLQGARLTAWELSILGIDHAVVPDGLAASLIAGGEVDVVVVGADRVAANGDVANKVGTYGLALAADRHDIPFVVAVPTATVDLDTADGSGIPIERRDPDEVATFAGQRVVPAGTPVENRAFDLTPAALVTAWVTEVGVAGSADELRRAALTGRSVSRP